MYEGLYGLRELPFRLTPDPHYLFLSEHHREALGHLLFGIREGAGFVAVTGEIGTGKTTLLRTLLRELEANTVVAYIFNPALSDLELLQTINSEFALPATSTSKKELVDALNRFLVAEKEAGRRVIVIVDEAQNLAPSVLEQLRLLSNLETETDKLLQIVLVGQPELRDMLGRRELEQLNQRITVRWHLAALERDETAAYVRHRLRIAGGPAAASLFTPAALRRIYGYARGVPRLINIVAHRALLIGYTEERRSITRVIVSRAVRELRRDDAASRRVDPSLRWRALGATAAALVLGIAAAFAALRPPHRPAAEAPPASAAVAAHASAEPSPAAQHEPPAPAPAPAQEQGAVPEAAAVVAVEQAQKAAPNPSTAVDPAPAAAAAEGEDHAAMAASDVASNDTTERPAATMTAAAALWDALAAVDHREAAIAAVSALLAAWKVEPLSAQERAGASLDLEAIAAKRGLRYLPTSGNLTRLQLLDLPAVLELSLPRSGQRRFALLARIDGTQPVVRFGGLEARLGPDEIGSAWLGDAHVFWRDFERFPPFLALGSSGPEVERLQQLLGRVGEYRDAPSSRFNAATAEAIARFQRSRRLPPDGIVGPLTKILLYGGVAGYERPRLRDDT